MNAADVTSREESLLLIGASRGLGYAIAEKFLALGWRVVATARRDSGTQLKKLAETSHGRLEVETVDINERAQVTALRDRLTVRTFDLLFVNAGVKNDDHETIADVSTDEFVRVMVTNALSPMRVVEDLQAQSDDLDVDGRSLRSTPMRRHRANSRTVGVEVGVHGREDRIRTVERSIDLLERRILRLNRSFLRLNRSFLRLNRSFLRLNRSFLRLEPRILRLNRSFLRLNRSLLRLEPRILRLNRSIHAIDASIDRKDLGIDPKNLQIDHKNLALDPINPHVVSIDSPLVRRISRGGPFNLHVDSILLELEPNDSPLDRRRSAFDRESVSIERFKILILPSHEGQRRLGIRLRRTRSSFLHRCAKVDTAKTITQLTLSKLRALIAGIPLYCATTVLTVARRTLTAFCAVSFT